MSRSQAHICHCLRRIKNLRRDSPLAIDGDRRKSGEEFADDVIGLARGLSALGVRCGDVIAIAALNSDFYMEWLLAITFVGGIAAPLNHRWSFDEARSAIEVVRPVMLVVDDRCSSWALALQNENCVPSVRLYAFIGGHPFQNLGSSGSVLSMDAIKMSALGPAVPELMWAPKGIALICFTSGTTGRPKGVAVSHIALTVQSLAKIAIVGYGESDVYLHTAPLCHIGGISSCIAMLLVAACHVFMPKFDAKLSFLAIKQHQVTSLITVPAMLADLISFARNSNNLNGGGETVNKILNGGGGLSSALINLAALTFPHTKIISAYGMTETCSSLTFMTIYDPVLQKSATSLSRNHAVNDEHVGVLVGKPAPHIELRISGDFDSLDSPSVGSILTRGSHVMVGYYGQRMEIMVDSKDGWLDTGDIGWIDGNGDLWLVGRKKDRIKSGGENIYPEEVEAVLARHPGVFKAVVVGVPNARLSEMVVACISIGDDWKWTDQKLSHSQGVQELSSEILQSFCRQHKLTRFKVPKIFIPWKQQYPQTTTGKLRREDVRKEVMTQMKLISSSL